MKMLFYKWHSFMNKGIEKALEQLGIAYDELFYQQDDWEEDERFEQLLKRKLADTAYDLVFSVNFAPVVSKVCEEKGIRYVSWVYDSPMHIRNMECMKNSCNEIYWFDRGRVEEYRSAGIPAFHMPLAVDTEVFHLPVSAKHRRQYAAEASLVGKLYRTEYAHYSAPLSNYTKGYLDGIVNAQMKLYGGYVVREVLTDRLLDSINREYREAGIDFQMGRRELEYMLACEATGRERYIILSLLANHYETSLYTSDQVEIRNIRQGGYVDYYSQMPLVFGLSRINLNISLKAILTGIPLRVLDVMGCGGFLLSNYQTEVVENFKIGEECEIYENIEDLYQKVKFYLEHEELRARIAANGFERVKRDFTFSERMRKMLF